MGHRLSVRAVAPICSAVACEKGKIKWSSCPLDLATSFDGSARGVEGVGGTRRKRHRVACVLPSLFSIAGMSTGSVLSRFWVQRLVYLLAFG